MFEGVGGEEGPRVAEGAQAQGPLWVGAVAEQGSSEGEIHAQFDQQQDTCQGPGGGSIRKA